jgi:hypothetical protein
MHSTLMSQGACDINDHSTQTGCSLVNRQNLVHSTSRRMDHNFMNHLLERPFIPSQFQSTPLSLVQVYQTC